MRKNKFWCIIVMLAFVLGTTVAISSCGDDDDNDNGGNTSGANTPGGNTGKGGGATAKNIVGTYTAITGNGYSISVMFADNGTGIITEKYADSYSGTDTQIQPFTYSMAGETGFMKKEYESYSGSKTYTIRIVEGFVLIEESDGDVELILYKTGQDLGKPDTKKIVGTWENNTDGETMSVTVNANGTGSGTSEYRSGSYSEKETFNFTYTMKNAYVTECTVKFNSSYSGSYTETAPVVVLNNKLYLCDRDGEVDREQILTRK